MTASKSRLSRRGNGLHDSDICEVGAISAHDGGDEAPEVALVSVDGPHFHRQAIVHSSRFLAFYPCPAKKLVYEVL